MRHPAPQRWVSAALSAVLLATNTLFAYGPEKSLWEERRRHARRGESHPLLLAGLPAAAPLAVLIEPGVLEAAEKAGTDLKAQVESLTTTSGQLLVAELGENSPYAVTRADGQRAVKLAEILTGLNKRPSEGQKMSVSVVKSPTAEVVFESGSMDLLIQTILWLMPGIGLRQTDAIRDDLETLITALKNA